jgi:hypothetical protein
MASKTRIKVSDFVKLARKAILYGIVKIGL